MPLTPQEKQEIVDATVAQLLAILEPKLEEVKAQAQEQQGADPVSSVYDGQKGNPIVAQMAKTMEASRKQNEKLRERMLERALGTLPTQREGENHG